MVFATDVGIWSYQVLVVAFMLVSAWLGTALFSDSTAEFKDYVTSLFNLFVLLTTANNPTVWATVYSANHLSFFFFFTYLIIGFFFLMSLAFSVVYSNYKSQVILSPITNKHHDYMLLNFVTKFEM
jgi:two pore calcium channel protein